MAKRITIPTTQLNNIEWTAEVSAILSSTGSSNVACLFSFSGSLSGSYEAALYVVRDAFESPTGSLYYSSSFNFTSSTAVSSPHPFFNGNRWFYAAGVLHQSGGYKEYVYFGEGYETKGSFSSSTIYTDLSSNAIELRRPLSYGRVEVYDLWGGSGGVCSDGTYIYTAEYDNYFTKRYLSNFETIAAITASADGPIGVCTDGEYVYTVCYKTAKIQKRGLDLSLLKETGSVGLGDGQFSNPYFIDTDGTYLYIADYANNRIKKHRCSDLSYVAKYGSSGSGNENLYTPTSVTVDKEGKYIYVNDYGNYRIVKRNASDLSYITEIGSYGTGEDQFIGTYDAAIGKNGRLYVLDYTNARIHVRNENDLSLIGFISEQKPYTIAFDFPSREYMIVGHYRGTPPELISRFGPENCNFILGTGTGTYSSKVGHGYYTEAKLWNIYIGSGSLNKRIYDSHNFSCDTISERKGGLVVHALGVEDVVSTAGGNVYVKNRAITGSTSILTGSGFDASSPMSTRFSSINYISDVEIPGEVEKIRVHNTSRLVDKTVDTAVASLELSPYQSVNKDISRHLPTVELLNDYIGKGIERYRDDYAELETARNVIFDRYLEQGVDPNTFFDACRFLDMKFVDLFKQFIPANIKFIGAEKTVESHALERNKIPHRFGLYKTPPALEDRPISGSYIIEGTVIDNSSGDIVCSSSVDGSAAGSSKELIDVYRSIFSGKLSGHAVKWTREKKNRIRMYSSQRPMTLTEPFETIYDSSVKSPMDITQYTQYFSAEYNTAFNYMNKKMFHSWRTRGERQSEMSYHHHQDIGRFGGASCIQGFMSSDLPVYMQNEVIWHRSGTIDVISGSHTSSFPTEVTRLGGASPNVWGTLILTSSVANIFDRLKKVMVHYSNWGQIKLDGRLNKSTYSCAINKFRGRLDIPGDVEGWILFYVGTAGTLKLELLWEDGTELGGEVILDMQYHYDRAMNIEAAAVSSDLSKTESGNEGYWIKLSSPSTKHITELFWKDKHGPFFEGQNDDKQRVNLYNACFARLVLVSEEGAEWYKRIFGKYWNGNRITPWLGWGSGLQSYYENQLMNGRERGNMGVDDKHLVSVKPVGSKLYCVWPRQDGGNVAKNVPINYDAYNIGAGYYPGYAKQSWTEGPEVNVEDYDHVSVFFYQALSGSFGSDVDIRVECKFQFAPTLELPFIDESMAYSSSYGYDPTLNDATTENTDMTPAHSSVKAHYVEQQSLIYRKEMQYKGGGGAPPVTIGNSWVIHKPLVGVARMKLNVREYSSLPINGQPQGSVPKLASAVVAVAHFTKTDKSVIYKDGGF